MLAYHPPTCLPIPNSSNQCSRFRNDGLALAPLANSLGHLFSLPKPSGGVLVLGSGLLYSAYDPCAALDDGRAWETEAIVLRGELPYSEYDPCAALEEGAGGGVVVLGGGLPNSEYGPSAALDDEAGGGDEIVLAVGLPYSAYDPSTALDDGAWGGVLALEGGLPYSGYAPLTDCEVFGTANGFSAASGGP